MVSREIYTITAYKCSSCNKSFEDRDSAALHKCEGTLKPLVECPDCGKAKIKADITLGISVRKKEKGY